MVNRNSTTVIHNFGGSFWRAYQSEGETLDLVLATHFLNSVAIEREVVPAAARRPKLLDWQVAVRVVTYGRVLHFIDRASCKLLPTCTHLGHQHRMTVTRGCIDTIFLS